MKSTSDKPSYAFITKKKINNNKLATVGDMRQIQIDDIHSRSVVIANLPEREMTFLTLVRYVLFLTRLSRL